MNFCRLTIEEPIFSVSNTEFEGGDDGHGLGDHTFLVKQAQPSHNAFPLLLPCNSACYSAGNESVTLRQLQGPGARVVVLVYRGGCAVARAVLL
jgi:hypothetical protein